MRLSDHSPSWDAGYDAVMVSGTIDSLDLPVLAAVTEGLDAALSSLRAGRSGRRHAPLVKECYSLLNTSLRP
ncbi:MAG: hypothetical protein AAFX65_13650 [Cyanobacteria bacterium J06638_7]